MFARFRLRPVAAWSLYALALSLGPYALSALTTDAGGGESSLKARPAVLEE